MTRTKILGLASGLVALTIAAAPAAQAHGHRHHGIRHHGHHQVHHVHKHFTYGHVVHVPVCVKFDWVHSAYGHAKWSCVLWN